MAKEISRNFVFVDESFTLERSAECAIPGYLVLRLKGEAASLAQLPTDTAQALGEMLARTAKAIEETVDAERVYILSFCEVDHRLHFHLFPRCAWLLKEYHKANFNANEPVDGPMLFAWARSAFGPGSQAPKGTPAAAPAAATIAAILEHPR